MVDTAFVGGGTATKVVVPPTGFTGYYTYESLFDTPLEGDDDFRHDEPHTVLRVEEDADWQTIVAAHRRLVKQFHPDRFVDHPPEVVSQAEAEIIRINQAYAEIRRRRDTSSSDRRSDGDRRQQPR